MRCKKFKNSREKARNQCGKPLSVTVSAKRLCSWLGSLAESSEQETGVY